MKGATAVEAAMMRQKMISKVKTMEKQRSSLTYHAARAVACALACAGAAGIIGYDCKRFDALEEALGRSNAITMQMSIDQKNFAEKLSDSFTYSRQTNAQLQEYRQQSARDKSQLEAKISMTNDELAKLSKERHDQLDAQQRRTLDYDTYKTTFKQSNVYADDKKTALEETTITIYDHDLVPDKKAYCAMTDDEIKKVRIDYIQRKSVKEIPRPPPPPAPPPEEHHALGGPHISGGPCR